MKPYTLLSVVLLAVFVRAGERGQPPILAHDMGLTCVPTGCLPAYDGVWDWDGPSGRAFCLVRYEATDWQRMDVGWYSFEVYFSPAAFSTITTDWEIDPSEVCGPSGNWISCACALAKVTVDLEVTTDSGRLVTQTLETEFMSGVGLDQLDFDPVAGAVAARMQISSSQRLFFLFEHTGNGFTDMTQCASAVARVRPVPTFQ